MPESQPGDPNTDWGAVDPSQHNVQGYINLLPGRSKFFEDREHPKNCNWYLLTLGCRRGLTFLEQQPEVDAQRARRAWLLDGRQSHDVCRGHRCSREGRRAGRRRSGLALAAARDSSAAKASRSRSGRCRGLFARTLGFESYAPLIRCPVLHRSGTNDFHGWMDDVYRTNALIQNQPHALLLVAASQSPPHPRGRRTRAAVVRSLPQRRPRAAGDAEVRVAAQDRRRRADAAGHARQGTLPVARVEIYYSIDPDPRARFWRDAGAKQEGDTWVAKLPVLTPTCRSSPSPMCITRCQSPNHCRTCQPITEVCLSSLLHSAQPRQNSSPPACGPPISRPCSSTTSPAAGMTGIGSTPATRRIGRTGLAKSPIPCGAARTARSSPSP